MGRFISARTKTEGMKYKLDNHSCTSGRCVSYQCTNSEIVASKKNKKYILNNDSEVEFQKYDLDDCVLKTHKTEGFRICDYLIHSKENKLFIWVELKGRDLNDACEQIYNSFMNAVEFEDHSRHFARIVLTRFNGNETRGSFFKLLKTKFNKNLHYATNQYDKDKSSLMYIHNF